MNNGSVYFLPPLISGLTAAILIPVAIRVARRYGLLDMPGRHKRHKMPTPLLGGSVLLVSFWLAVVAVVVIDKPLFREVLPVFPYLFWGSLVIFLVGLSDDLRPLSAWAKLTAQVAAGLILYMGGLSIDPLTVPFVGAVSTGWFSVVITVLWVVGLTNAVNIIDGLDGLASGVSLIAALSLIVVGAAFSDWSVVVLALVLAGFLAVFLVFNRYPAKIFLGDSGSLQLGFYFAVISLLVPIRTFTATALYLPLLALGVPLLETVISFSRRVVSGRNVMKADRRHLFHYLALAGLSPRRIVLIFYLLSLAFGLFTVATLYLNRAWVFGFLVLFMVVIFVLFYILMANSNLPGRRQGVRKPR